MQSPTRTGYPALGGFLLAVVLAAVLSLTASSTTGASQVSRRAAFRHQLVVFVNQWCTATRYQATPQGRATFAELRYDPSSNLARARAGVRR